MRTVSAGLICAASMTVAACGSKGAEPTAAPAPAATTAAASSAPTAAASSAPAVATAADKTLCESVKKAGDEMKTQLIDVFKSGEKPTPTAYRKILTGLGGRLDTAASTAGDGPVATAIRDFAAVATTAAATDDPAKAIEDPSFEKTATAITVACKPTGVNANF
jgi:hypothetical protein